MSQQHHIPHDTAVLAITRRLSDAIARVTFIIKEPGKDITHGTTFYTPIITLLARDIGTKRVDHVLKVYPVLCAPFFTFESKLPIAYAQVLTARFLQDGLDVNPSIVGGTGHKHPAMLHEIIDLLQSVARWSEQQVVEWVREVEQELSRKPEFLLMLQAAADEAVTRHDREGMLTNKPQLNEGLVIDVTGPGRVN